MNVTVKKRIAQATTVLAWVIVGVVLIWFGIKLNKILKYETTNDAQVNAYINPVVSRVGGYIQEIRFTDFQEVKKGDTLVKKPFSVYKISQVNIFTNNTSRKERNQFNDSVTYRNFNIYSAGKLKYKPKAITNAIFIEKGKLFSDNDRTLTSKSLSNLKVFNYPNIEYVEDPNDSTNSSLIANIYLMSKPKYIWQPSIDVTTSDIQQFGISGRMAFTWRNLFKRAETFELSARGNIGSSKDLANPNNVFFNIYRIS